MDRLHQLVVAATLAAFTSAASAVDRLVLFGDSLSDAGNIALVVGADPAQVITGNSYIPSQPYASMQFTNGDVWAKTFASAIGLAPFGQPSLLGGGNFAFGGARTATDGTGLPPSLLAQEAMFLGATGGIASPTALYVIAGGGNDARDALQTAAANPANAAAVIGAAALAYAQSMGTLVDQLQAAGGVDIVVWNVPDLSLAPAVTTLGATASFLGSQVASAMNAALAARMATESDVLLFDIFSLQGSFGAGFSNVTDACGAVPNCDPSAYVYWDGIHPTSGGHAAIARAMLEQTAFITAVPEPETYALMLAGLGMVAMYRRKARQGVAAA